MGEIRGDGAGECKCPAESTLENPVLTNDQRKKKKPTSVDGELLAQSVGFCESRGSENW